VAHVVDAIAVGYEAADHDRLTAADGPAADFTRFIRELAAERARDPRDDLVSALAVPRRARGDLGPPGTSEDDDELAGTLLGVLMGGLAPVAAAICLEVRTITRPPDPQSPADTTFPTFSDALSFADELLRHDGIVNFTALPRVAVRDVELPSGAVPQGADVRVGLAAANRDPAAFPDADRFDPGRDRTAALSFSSGLHRCLAPGLARTQIAAAVTQVGARLPGLTVAGTPGWYDSVRVRAIRQLPVSLATP
jgi:cytochrome P450 family 114